MIMYYHLNFMSALMQILTPSKVVMQTSKLPGAIWFLMISSLLSFLAMRLTTLQSGNQRLNSDIQFPTTDFGMMIKWKPLIDLNSLRKLINEID